MSSRRLSQMQMIYELLKLLRNNERSRAEVAKDLGWMECTARKWCDEGVAHGLLVERIGESDGRMGRMPRLLSLAGAWKGPEQ